MAEKIYLYEPRGYSPGIAFRFFHSAISQLFEDEGVGSLEELIESLPEGWWYEFTADSISIDDGARITQIELR